MKRGAVCKKYLAILPLYMSWLSKNLSACQADEIVMVADPQSPRHSRGFLFSRERRPLAPSMQLPVTQAGRLCSLPWGY